HVIGDSVAGCGAVPVPTVRGAGDRRGGAGAVRRPVLLPSGRGRTRPRKAGEVGEITALSGRELPPRSDADHRPEAPRGSAPRLSKGLHRHAAPVTRAPSGPLRRPALRARAGTTGHGSCRRAAGPGPRRPSPAVRRPSAVPAPVAGRRGGRA